MMQDLRNIRVLIVEDDEFVTGLIERLLRNIGYAVVGKALDGVEAVEMTQTLKPNVVLMDIAMPNMNGIEATRLIQERCPTPVVVLTAYDRLELIERASAAGAGAYLVKPPNAREIERAIIVTIARFNDMMALRRLNAELQTEIAERKRIEESLQRRLAAEELVTAVSTRLVSATPDKIEGEITRALQTVGEFAGADRSFISMFARDGTRIERVYEWCAEGVSPHAEYVTGLPLKPFQWTMSKLERVETIDIASMDDLPLEASVEKDFWLAQGVQSSIVIPLVLRDGVVGYWGFNSRRIRTGKLWAEEDIRLLKLVGEIIVTVLECRKAK